MCKRGSATVLALLLLLVLIPLNAAAEQTHLLVISTEAGENYAAQVIQTIRQIAMYSNWNCRYQNAGEPVDLNGCEGVLICLDESKSLPEETAAVLRESKLPLFVIGSSALQQLAPVRHERGAVVVRLETEDYQNSDVLLKQTEITLLNERGESLGGTVFVGNTAWPLCQTVGNVTHLACYEAGNENFFNYLASCLQTWRWPFDDPPRGYGFYLVLDRVYPFDDPARLMAITDMLEAENVPYALTVMPIYANGEYPSMKRFCEYLTYVQSRGASIILHAPLVTLANVEADEIKQHINIAFEAYANYGVYPLAIQAPEPWLMSARGLSVLTGFRTVFTFKSAEGVFGDRLNINLAVKDGHQLIASAWADALTYTDAYAQAIYLDINQDVEKIRTKVRDIKRSRATLKSLRDVQHAVYAGDNYLSVQDGIITYNGKEADLEYKRFTYAENYEFDRGLVQNLKQQIEEGNKLILLFVAVSSSFFCVAIMLLRRSIRSELLTAKKKKSHKPVERKKGEAKSL